MTNPTSDKVLKAFDAAGHEYLDINDLVKTHDTLDDFRCASATWSECSAVFDETYCGFPAIEFDGVQIRKGMQRGALTVVDFGSVRYSYNQ